MPCKFTDVGIACSRNNGSKCRSCGAPIKWIKTGANKSIPLNTELVTILPGNDGKVVIITLDGKWERGNLVMVGTPGAVQGHTSHFATCPQADQWRK